MERTEHNRKIVELMKTELELQKEIDQNKLSSSNFNVKDMRLLNLRLERLKTEGDLTDDKVFKLEQAIIHQTTDFKLQEAINDNKSTALILKQHEIDMQELLNKRTQQFKNETIDVEEAWKRVNQTITSSVTSGIKGLIKGTATWADLLNNVADKFLEIALNQAIYGNILGQMGKAGGGKTGGILGFLGFADGGRPPVGKPSIVGEKGPELFVPSSSGKIVPNHELGGGGSVNVTVNVDASGTDVQGDDSQAKQLGTMLSAAVQAELVKQKLPGGLLAGVA
jgi:phage-related minor tail protein